MVSQNGITTVHGSELIGSGLVAAGFAVSSYSMDPGQNPLLNMWIGAQASLYNKYRFTSLTLKYVPFVGTQTQGRVMMAWTGDSKVTPPGSMVTLSQYTNSKEAPVWMPLNVSFVMPKKPEFVYSATATDNTVCPGSFFVGFDAGSGQAQGAGSFYLDYVCQLWERSPTTQA